jgi:hypothetical protein
VHGARAAVVAFAVAALLPGSARPDPLADAEQGAVRLEDLLAAVDESARRPEETPADRAAQKYSSGETQYLFGDWPHAALLLGEALDDGSFRAGPRHLLSGRRSAPHRVVRGGAPVSDRISEERRHGPPR